MLIIPKLSRIIVDFDFTVSHFVGGLDGLYEIFTRQGVDQAIVKDCEQAAEASGFTIGRYQTLVEVSTGKKFNSSLAAAQFSAWLNVTLRLYPDSLHALTAWREQKIPVAVLMFGNPDYQQQKIAATGIPYDQAFFVTKSGKKADMVKSLISENDALVVFIEDNPAELDNVVDSGLTRRQVFTIKILRSDSPYRHQTSRHRHQTINNLQDLSFT